MSQMVQDSLGLDDDDDEEIKDTEIRCPKVNTQVLAKVVEYCTHYQTVEEMNAISTPLSGETLEEVVSQEWYVNFCDMEREMLFKLVAAANYLNIKPLLDLTCLAVSISIKGKSVEELRSIFKIPAPQPPPVPQAIEEESEVVEESKAENEDEKMAEEEAI